MMTQGEGGVRPVTQLLVVTRSLVELTEQGLDTRGSGALAGT